MKEHSKRWWLLSLLALAQFMVVLDVSIMNVALPSVQKTLGLSISNLQWIVTVYTLAFGGFLLFGGRAADLFGRRRMFVTGVISFATVSLLVGLAQNDLQMIVLRGLQGLCAAFMSPAALSIVLATFHDPHERARALSIWGMVAAGGAAAGLLIGGLLTQYLSWRWNFFINVPVGFLVGYFAYRLAPAHESEETDRRLDIFGALLITSAMILLVYSLSQASTWGWQSPTTLGCLALAAALVAAFFYNESRVARPLVPLSVFKIGNIVGADLTQLPITASLFSVFFFVSLYAQTILGYSPIQSGLAFLVMPVIIAISANLAPRVIRAIGYKPILVVAPLSMMCGLFILAHVPLQGVYVQDIMPGLMMMAVGMGFSFVSLTIAATSGVPRHFSGLASGLLNTSQQIGGALGLAILSSVAASTTAAFLAQNPGMQQAAMVEGFHSAFYTAMIFSALASCSALFLIKSHGRGVAETAPAVH